MKTVIISQWLLSATFAVYALVLLPLLGAMATALLVPAIAAALLALWIGEVRTLASVSATSALNLALGLLLVWVFGRIVQDSGQSLFDILGEPGPTRPLIVSVGWIVLVAAVNISAAVAVLVRRAVAGSGR